VGGKIRSGWFEAVSRRAAVCVCVCVCVVGGGSMVRTLPRFAKRSAATTNAEWAEVGIGCVSTAGNCSYMIVTADLCRTELIKVVKAAN
jgi:hypothetical protein